MSLNFAGQNFQLLELHAVMEDKGIHVISLSTSIIISNNLCIRLVQIMYSYAILYIYACDRCIMISKYNKVNKSTCIASLHMTLQQLYLRVFAPSLHVLAEGECRINTGVCIYISSTVLSNDCPKFITFIAPVVGRVLISCTNIVTFFLVSQ